MEEKQTAVEWLEEMMNVNGNISVYFQEILDQAKAMEKEQLSDQYYQGRVKGFDEGCKYTAEN